jgi:hypothetical protein
LPYDPVDQIAAWCRSVEELVLETHGLPLEQTHLVERLNLDPFDVFHGRNEPSYAVDIRRIVGFAGNKREADPGPFRQRG